MIKNKIYGVARSAAAVVPAEPAVLPAFVIAPIKPYKCMFKGGRLSCRMDVR